LEEVPFSTKATTKKGNKLHFSSSPSTASTKVKKPFTRSLALKEVFEEQVLPKVSIMKKKRDKGKGIEKPVEVVDRTPIQHKYEGEIMKKPIEVININTPPRNHAFKILIRQLKEDRKEASLLKSEGLSEIISMKDLMDNYNNALDLEIFAARRALPVHKQLKNLYRKNIDF
jgi:hypothetical protein